jgi:hypothetical protein
VPFTLPAAIRVPEVIEVDSTIVELLFINDIRELLLFVWHVGSE